MANAPEFIDEPDTIRNEAMDNGLLTTGSQTTDTREKLEADVDSLVGKIQERVSGERDAGALRFQLRELLDRQAAITGRHWMEIVGASANANVELTRRIDLLQNVNVELTRRIDLLQSKPSGGRPQNLEYVGYADCPLCGDDCAEVWRDGTDGKEYTRCPFIGCDGWGKLVEPHTARRHEGEE